jgi:hypothetical protein
MTVRENGPILPGEVRPARNSKRRLLSVLVLSVPVATCIVFRPTDGNAAPALPGDSCQVEPRST